VNRIAMALRKLSFDRRTGVSLRSGEHTENERAALFLPLAAGSAPPRFIKKIGARANLPTEHLSLTRIASAREPSPPVLRATETGRAPEFRFAVSASNSMVQQPLTTIHVTASFNDVFIDFRSVLRSLDAFLAFESAISTEIYAPDQNQFCVAEHETEELLGILDQAISQAIYSIENDSPPGENFVEAQLCPDSLMSVGDTCADFYIAAMRPTLPGVVAIGNGRGPMPYADVTQSKFQFVPQFDQNKIHLLVNGSTISSSIQLLPSDLGGVPVPISITIPNNPFQVERFEVSAPNATTRVVDLKIVNADCAAVTSAFSAHLGPGQLISNFVDWLCPAIDATLTYSKVDGRWTPTYQDRDAFPTMDIWRKDSNGQLSTLYHSPEGPAFWRGLTGLHRIREEIRLEKQRLDEDQACFTY